MYKITDYATISSNMTYTLPDTVLQIIKQLGVELGVSTNPLPLPPIPQIIILATTAIAGRM